MTADWLIKSTANQNNLIFNSLRSLIRTQRVFLKKICFVHFLSGAHGTTMILARTILMAPCREKNTHVAVSSTTAQTRLLVKTTRVFTPNSVSGPSRYFYWTRDGLRGPNRPGQTPTSPRCWEDGNGSGCRPGYLPPMHLSSSWPAE